MYSKQLQQLNLCWLFKFCVVDYLAMYKKSTYCKVSGGTTILKSQLKTCDIWNGQGTKSDVKKVNKLYL